MKDNKVFTLPCGATVLMMAPYPGVVRFVITATPGVYTIVDSTKELETPLPSVELRMTRAAIPSLEEILKAVKEHFHYRD